MENFENRKNAQDSYKTGSTNPSQNRGGLVAGLLVGVMFIVVGNFLPKARQNYTIGIKIPWTLASEENWNKTHRLAGFLWMICGAIMVILTLCGKMASVWMMIVAAVMVGVPVVYSYLMYRKEEKE